ncbi:hypothetical protein HYX14_00690 [Candidatus Woesearchaeota archaeon]|nr:hypothetical protein [Candidatus Woesearchaeota archaeon]
MALHNQSWRQKLFTKKAPKPVDVLKDLQAISEFLKEIKDDTKLILPELKKLEELEKERKVASDKGVLLVNLQTQAELLDRLLERYQFFQDDVDINGIRVKNIAAELLKNADQAGLKDLVKEKQKDLNWKFEW